MEIKNFIQNYRQSYSRYDKEFNWNQLEFLKNYYIYKIKISEKKNFFNIFFDYNSIKCALFFIELKDNKYIFEFKDFGDPDKTFKYKIEVEKDSKFNTIEKAIQLSVLEIAFDNFEI